MIRVTSFGKLKSPWRDDLVARTKRLMPFDWVEIPLKRQPNQRSSTLLLEEQRFLKAHKNFWLMDVHGKCYNDQEFYAFASHHQDLHLLVGPAVGFHPKFFERAKGKVSLSKLTFTHELAQTMLAESLYRVACRMKNHPFVK